MERLSGVVKNKTADLDGPYQAQSTRYHVVVEGAIYNTEELGHRKTPAQLVLELVEKYGVLKTLPKLNADFALAVYDREDDILWLARDRFGVLPLYYLKDPTHRVFAAQPSGVHRAANVPLIIDEAFVARFAGNHYRGVEIDPTGSPYANVAQVAPATVVRLDGRTIKTFIYWSLTEQPDWQVSADELADEYRALILDAVRIRLTDEDHHAFTLSGGMDSSTAVASAAYLLGDPQPAFSTVYDDPTFDESADIEPMLERCVVPWNPVPVRDPNVFSLVREMVAVHDEPVPTATWLSHYLLTQAVAAQGFTTLWGGLGGDEVNAGEYEYFMYFFADLRRLGRRKQLATEITRWVAYHNHPIYQKSVGFVEQELPRLVDWQQPGQCIPDRGRLQKYHQALMPEWAAQAEHVVPAPQPFSSYLKNRTYQDLTRETLPCCLRAEDRNAAAAGLSRRLPWLDWRIVEFMYRIPVDLKIRQGITKYLLRQATRGILPEATRMRVKKTGWNAPAHQWFVGAGREQLLDMVHSQIFRQRGIYNIPVVERLIDEHAQIVESGRVAENHMMFLWQLVNLETWLASTSRLHYTFSDVETAAAIS